jgi:catechol 2,3-dioxygenase-like lactoylglutathione lyase family enzyme
LTGRLLATIACRLGILVRKVHDAISAITRGRGMNEPELKPHAYVLAVRDLAGAVAYFVEILGFAREWADADNWQALIRGDVRLMLGRCPDALPAAELGDHSYFGFFATGDVDTLHAEFKARAALILSAPADKPWGWREMAVATPEGHRMMFAQPI